MRLFRRRKDDEKVKVQRMVQAMQAHQEYQMYLQQQQVHRQSPYQSSSPYPKPPPPPPRNEYEYVRREHGYDYMPPSQYVPSRSLSEDSDEDAVDPPVRIEVPASDISESVVDNSLYADYDRYQGGRRRKTPVVRGKPINPKNKSRRSHDKHLQPVPEYEQEVLIKQRRHGGRGETPSYHKREASYGPQSGSGDPVLLAQAAPNIASPMVRQDKPIKRQSPSFPDHPGYDRYGRERQHRSSMVRDYDNENIYRDDRAGEIPQVPTAFSYHSEDSAEDDNSKTSSRYDVTKENEYRRLVGLPPRKEELRAKDRRRSHEHHHRSQPASSLESFTTPAYRSRSRDGGSVPGRVIEGPREHRSEPQDLRRRSRTRDVRDALEDYEDPPLGMQSRVRGTRDVDLDVPYPAEPFDENPSRGYYVEDPRMLKKDMKDRRRQEVKARQEKIKPKAIFSRIKDSVRGEKPSRRMVEAAWSQELREKGSLFEKEPPSIESDLSPHPPHQEYDALAPFLHDGAYYQDRIPRTGSRALSPRELVPRPRGSPYDPRFIQPPPDYMYGAEPEVPRYRHVSGKPFETSREATPALRANPDHRQRPLANSMSRHYRPQHQVMGARGANRGAPLSPRGLQFDPTLANTIPRSNKGVIGCY